MAAVGSLSSRWCQMTDTAAGGWGGGGEKEVLILGPSLPQSSSAIVLQAPALVLWLSRVATVFSSPFP